MAPEPPYTMTFRHSGSDHGAGCAVVWLEIPIPFAKQPDPQ